MSAIARSSDRTTRTARAGAASGQGHLEYDPRATTRCGDDLDETADERRLRHAACLLGDIGWRGHPDYRGEQAMNIIAHGAFVAVDHPGRAYLALSVYFRHAGLGEEDLSPRLRELATTRMLDRARVLGAAMRVAYILTAGQSGVLTKTPMQVKRGRLVLKLPGRYRRLMSDRLAGRLRQLARLVGREAAIEA